MSGPRIGLRGNAAFGAEVALAAAVLAGVGLVGSLFTGRLTPQVTEPEGMSASMQERVDKTAAASLFGQMRTSFSDFLWLKADRYLHNGVELRGLTPMEKEAGVTVAQSAKGEQAKGYRAHRGDETTVVPDKQFDWRGHLGDLEREVQPYQDMSHHTHREPKEAIPLFRLMTLANPHFIPGYTVGAMLIAQDKTRWNEALRYLEEGVANNPENMEMHAEIGQFLTARFQRYADALPHVQKAVALGAQRDVSTLSEDEHDAYQNAYRWLVLTLREQGNIPAAKEAAKAGLALFPEDIVCRRMLGQESK